MDGWWMDQVHNEVATAWFQLFQSGSTFVNHGLAGYCLPSWPDLCVVCVWRWGMNFLNYYSSFGGGEQTGRPNR